MQSKEFFKALEMVAEERNLEKEKILDIMSRGILNAYKKIHATADNARVEFNEDKNEIMLYADLLVVPDPDEPGEISLEEARTHRKSAKIGDTITVKESPKDFGRIAASSAKQILTQGLKQLERERIYDIFKEREGEMINTEIVSVNRDFVTLDMGHGLETSLPRKELSLIHI